MTADAEMLERRIAEWRAFVARGKAIAGHDVEELEGHLRDQIEALAGAGLDADEAFLVAVKRIGSLNALSREYAREHSERLWRQLVLAGDGPGGKPLRSEPILVVALAVAAAVAIKLPELFGMRFADETAAFYVRNLAEVVA